MEFVVRVRRVKDGNLEAVITDLNDRRQDAEFIYDDLDIMADWLVGKLTNKVRFEIGDIE